MFLYHKPKTKVIYVCMYFPEFINVYDFIPLHVYLLTKFDIWLFSSGMLNTFSYIFWIYCII